MRLIERRSKLEEKLTFLQEEIKREEELTTQVLQEEKVRGKEELATFQSTAGLCYFIIKPCNKYIIVF